ncbi:MAG: hypothetical protein DMG74_15575 [Acidobacteria bacterium]|nr:MAG: hypothetical protein DMG75_11665 [Acidobacteriota bacterium]PYX63795.1 MAG: hypothetical protein DMG74_15575 [Acidobacteriota bacterium]
MKKVFSTIILFLVISTAVRAADNLRLNPKLDFSSDSQDGPLIIGDHMDDGAQKGKPNYIIIYGEG